MRWAVALGVGIRLLWLALGSGRDRFLMPDSVDYTSLAGDLGAFSATSTPSLELLSLYRPPLYPLFVWVTSLGDPDRALLVVLAQVALAGLNIALCFRLAQRLVGRRVATVAALLLAVDPVSVSHSLLITTETLTTTFVLVGLVALAEARERASLGPRLAWAAAGGFALALSSLVRPVALYLVPLLAVVALFTPAGDPGGGLPRSRWRRSFALAAVFLVAAAVPVAAWFARNDALSGRPVYSTVQGENLALYGLGSVAAERGDIRLRYAGSGTDDTSVADADPGIQERASRRALGELGVANPDRPPPGLLQSPEYAAAVDAQLSAEGFDLLRSHPRGAVLLGAYGGARMMALPGATANVDQLRPGLRVAPVRAAIWAWAVGWVVLVDLTAIVGLVLIWRRTSAWAAALVVAPLAYYVLASAGTFAYVRFRVPISPLMCILAAVTIIWLRDRASRGGRGIGTRSTSP